MIAIPLKHHCSLLASLQRVMSHTGRFRRSMSEFEETARTPDQRHLAEDIFLSCVKAVSPQTTLSKAFQVTNSTLVVGEWTKALNHNVTVVGFGKAVLGMAAYVDALLGDHIIRGIVSIPKGLPEVLLENRCCEMLLKATSHIEVREGAKDNLPDEASLAAAKSIHDIVEPLGEEDLLIVLISGGGSSLLPSPAPPITLSEKHHVTKLLAHRGATIADLNVLRREISCLKGGGLAQLAFPAQVLSLIISDAIGDPLEVIASGPTVPNPTGPTECLDLLAKFGISDLVPSSVIDHLQRKLAVEAGGHDSAPQSFAHVHNVIVGNNKVALEAAEHRATSFGYSVLVLSTGIMGDVHVVARFYRKLTTATCRLLAGFTSGSPPADLFGTLQDVEMAAATVGLRTFPSKRLIALAQTAAAHGRGLCLLAGGETTVEVRGIGKGGRNQELAMRVACEMDACFGTNELTLDDFNMTFLAAGTDGQDGPTEAAGAVIHPGILGQARALGLDPFAFLNRSDSFGFFSAMGGKSLVLTGFTGTNVMDLHLLLVCPCSQVIEQ
uniref:glycerate kinase n=1 Tax=Myxine glutinosa TaxID=7769 RepID=UPI00358DFC29